MGYPGFVLKDGMSDEAVRLVRARLTERGYGPQGDTTYFDDALKAATSLFQAQNVDLMDRPLRQDGEVGPNTWASLFGSLDDRSGADIPSAALRIAEQQLNVREDPPGSNAGPMVEQFLGAVGLGRGNPWCMAFIYWCFQKAAGPAPCPVPRSGSVLEVYRQTLTQNPARIISVQDALRDPARVRPGVVFIQDHGHNLGHAGFVKSSRAGALVTVEGNTNIAAGREGVGVFELTRRSLTDAQLVCLIDFSL